MPTYEYQCQKCSHSFDVFHSMTEKPVVKCPKCKGKARKMLSAGAGIIFKGSGFYETDYKRKGSPTSEPAAASTDASPSVKKE